MGHLVKFQLFCGSHGDPEYILFIIQLIQMEIVTLTQLAQLLNHPLPPKQNESKKGESTNEPPQLPTSTAGKAESESADTLF